MEFREERINSTLEEESSELGSKGGGSMIKNPESNIRTMNLEDIVMSLKMEV